MEIHTSDSDPEANAEKKWNGTGTNGDNSEAPVQAGTQNALSRELRGRHMQMIAFGGSIGAGLFVGSGSALQKGGPGSLLIGWIITGIFTMCTIFALAELTVTYPVNGAFYNYTVRFINPSWGFAMGINYALGWLLSLPNELSAAGVTIEFWRPDLNNGIWVASFLVALALVQLFGVRGYGEVEFILSIIKITAVLGFIILAIVIDCGGVSTDPRGYIGAQYFHNPGSFRHGFKGFCSVFVTAAFSYSGTELVGLAAAEAADPRKEMPKASRQVFWRITIFYIVSLLMIGLIVPSNDSKLLGASGANTASSPFVLAIQNAGIKGLPSVFNAVITLSVLSVGNSAIFGSTRTLQAMARQGMVPRVFEYIDKKGRPLATVILAFICGLIGFVGEASSSATVFSWLTSLAGLSVFFAFGSICLAHIRFRYAWKAAGRTLDELAWASPLGVLGSWIGFILTVICLIATFYVALFPIGSPPNATDFFQEYLAAPIAIVSYIFWKIYTKEKSFYVRIEDIDLDTGRRIFETETVKEKEPWHKQVYHFFF